ncbi:MAG: uncharacterized protein JWO06_468 [Bacteroidota bacterium]|nr:uncharacterized protein [Bacteroidota bacterium]
MVITMPMPMKKNYTCTQFILILFLALMSLGPLALKAQWTNVGATGFTYGSVIYPSLAIDKNGKAYIAYSDSARGYQAGAMRFDTSHWVQVGVPAFSPGKSFGVSLAMDTANKPYVAFGDSTASGTLSIMRYDPITRIWYVVANAISRGSVYQWTSLVIDKHNNLYVAYTDLGDTGKVVVKKYNGSAFSIAYRSPGRGFYPSLVLNNANDTVFLGFKDQAQGGKASVVNVISKTYVGTAGFSPNAAVFTSIAKDTSDILHLAYVDSVTGAGTVVKYTGGSWTTLGSSSFSAGPVSYTSLAISRGDSVFVAFSDTNGYAAVMNYTGTGTSGWSLVGNPDFSAGPVAYVTMALDTLGHPYVGYRDGGHNNKAGVMSYVCASPALPQVVADSVICAGNQGVLRIATGSLNSSVQWQWYSGSCGGTFIDSATEINIGPGATTTYYVRGTGLCHVQDSCIAITVRVDTLVTPSITITADKDSVCPGTAITFRAITVNGGQDPIFQWKKNGQNINATDSVYRDSTLTNGDRITCVLFPSGCATLFLTLSNVIKVNVTTGPQANITANGPLTFCSGDSITLQVLAADSSYHWSTGDSVAAITVKQTGVYSVTTTLNGCLAHNSVSVTAAAHNLSPVIAHSRPLIICPGGSVALDAGAGYSTYHWSTGDSTEIIFADTTATYRVTVTQNTCVGNTSVLVIDSNNYEPVVHISPPGPINACLGDTIILDAGPNFDVYQWGGVGGDSTQTIVVDSSGNYFVNVLQNGCQGSDAVDVTIHTVAPPTILSSDTLFSICNGHNLTLRTNFQYNSYLWSTGSNSATIFVTDTGTYNVTVSVNTCTGTAVSPVHVYDFSHQAITLDTIQDTTGVTTIFVHPNTATNYFWQSTGDTGVYSTSADSLVVYCYKVIVKSLIPNWTLIDSAYANIYVITSLGGCKDTSAVLTISCNSIISAASNIPGISNLSLLPNPTSASLNINYELNTATELQINVMDMQGRKLLPVLNEKENAGLYTQQVNVNNLAAGVYLLSFENGNERLFRRFVRE